MDDAEFLGARARYARATCGISLALLSGLRLLIYITLHQLRGHLRRTIWSIGYGYGLSVRVSMWTVLWISTIYKWAIWMISKLFDAVYMCANSAVRVHSNVANRAV